ncbi:MAG TPA: hypothetical protein VK824_03630 [Planctomycetota bacterium]|nr:hypothetical protein [Planctomycetota bacterium]
MTVGDDSPLPHEEALVRAFMRPDRRPRYLELLRTPERRRKLRARLAHMRDLDPRYAQRIPDSDQNADAIQRLLNRKGAPMNCFVISGLPALDGQAMPLGLALEEIVGSGMGSLVSCIPGRLGYYESEDVGERYVLYRTV